MPIVIHDVVQGSDEWHHVRCGILTASEVKLLLTPGKLQPANNDKSRAHVYELLAQRITNYVEPTYIGDAMLRGHEEEVYALETYSEHYAPVEQVGFITNDKWGFVIGCSPDALVGEDGIVECKSRCQKYQAQTILADEMPDEFLLQVQTLLLVTERKWCDFVSYCGGMPMYVKRIYPDAVIQDAIITAAKALEDKLAEFVADYNKKSAGLVPTERRIFVADDEIEPSEEE